MATSSDKIIQELTALGGETLPDVFDTLICDVVAPRGGSLAGAALETLATLFPYEPKALASVLDQRVAEGWLTRDDTRVGECYRLSEPAKAEVEAMRRRIYATAPALTDPWRLVHTPEPLGDGFIQVWAELFLGHSQSPVPENALVVSGTVDALPEWIMTALAPNALLQDYDAFEDILIRARDTACDDPPQAVKLRIMLVHQWRRLLSRHPDLPAAFFPDTWRGEACRAVVLDLHDTWSRLADPWLNETIFRERGGA